jgi:hypothetical protein
MKKTIFVVTMAILLLTSGLYAQSTGGQSPTVEPQTPASQRDLQRNTKRLEELGKKVDAADENSAERNKANEDAAEKRLKDTKAAVEAAQKGTEVAITATEEKLRKQIEEQTETVKELGMVAIIMSALILGLYLFLGDKKPKVIVMPTPIPPSHSSSSAETTSPSRHAPKPLEPIVVTSSEPIDLHIPRLRERCKILAVSETGFIYHLDREEESLPCLGRFKDGDVENGDFEGKFHGDHGWTKADSLRNRATLIFKEQARKKANKN